MVMEKPKQNSQKLQHLQLDLIWVGQFKDILICLHYNKKHFDHKAYSKIDEQFSSKTGPVLPELPRNLYFKPFEVHIDER